MASLLTNLDPRNINWRDSPHKVTPEISAKNDAKIDKLEKEQKLLSSKLKSGAYKNTNDLNAAWQLQNRSFQKISDHRDAWDETTSTHPRVNKQREIEMDRFLGNARAIKKQYDNIIHEYAKKKGICGYLLEEDCTQGKDCYWFGKEDVAGKNVGCYSRKEARKNWSVGAPIKRSKKTNLPILGEEERRITIPMVTAAKARLSRLPEQQSMSENPEEKKEGGRTRKKRRKRKTRCKKRKRKKMRRRTNRRTNRRTKRRKR